MFQLSARTLSGHGTGCYCGEGWRHNREYDRGNNSG